MAENQVGTLGQMYEDRKSGKLGVLESREEKYKTLLFRGEDGKTFSIQYSTFRSNWRKYQGDVKIQTSTQVQATADKNQKEVEKAKEAIKEPKKGKTANAGDRRKSALTREEHMKLQEDGSKVIKSAFDDNNKDDIFSLTQKLISKNSQIRSTIKCGKEEIAEIWIMCDKSNVGNAKFFMPEEPFKEAVFSNVVGKIEATHSTNPKEKRPNSFKLSTDKLEDAIADLVTSLAPVYADKKEANENK